MRPTLFVSDPTNGDASDRGADSRAVDGIQDYIREGCGLEIWNRILATVESNRQLPPFTLETALPGRDAEMTRLGAHDWYIATQTSKRVVYAAFAHLISRNPDYLSDALMQADAILDPDRWPDWRHEVNTQRGVVADHRVGHYVLELSLAYDWLHPFLSEERRTRFREGVLSRGVDRILSSRERDDHWGNYNNWTGLIVAGMGFAGMAFSGEYPGADELIRYSTDWMTRYISLLGEQGEFNESPAYSASMMTPIRFFAALDSYRRNVERTESADLPERLHAFGHWYAHHVLPPDRIVAFGDLDRDMPPNPLQLGAIARLFSDPVLQWFYLTYRHLSRYDDYPSELFLVNPDLAATPPAGRWPCGIVFPGYGNHVISRTDWDPVAPACVVASKGAHGWEESWDLGETGWFHLDYDAGQVCIDGSGRRLIVDLNNTGGYCMANLSDQRARFFGKGTIGHNVLMFGGRNTLERTRDGESPARVVSSRFDAEAGGVWNIDLTGVYSGATRVCRSVAHLYPGFVLVLDTAALERPETSSLRWHTEDRAAPDTSGQFSVQSGPVRCTTRIINLGEGPCRIVRREHRCEAPFDVNYHGIPYEQHQSYIEATVTSSRVELLTFFAVSNDHTTLAKASGWVKTRHGWQTDIGDGAEVTVTDDVVSIDNRKTGATLRIDRQKL